MVQNLTLFCPTAVCLHIHFVTWHHYFLHYSFLLFSLTVRPNPLTFPNQFPNSGPHKTQGMESVHRKAFTHMGQTKRPAVKCVNLPLPNVRCRVHISDRMSSVTANKRGESTSIFIMAASFHILSSYNWQVYNSITHSLDYWKRR
jgi:hypothetical protein